jgi:CBS domain-containing protein
MNLERVFSRNIVRTQSSATLEQAAKLMRDHHVGALLVTEPDDALAGIVSVDDIVGAKAAELASLGGMLGSELQREVARVGESGELTS